jgi:integrase
VASYRRAIKYAVIRANKDRALTELPLLAERHPHQLRHTCATLIRKECGIEIARIILGHSSLDVTQIYAEADMRAAMSVMSKLG